MPPSTARAYLVGKLGSYEVPNLARVDSHLRGLRVRRLDGGPLLPKVLDDIDALLERRLELMKGTR